MSDIVPTKERTRNHSLTLEEYIDILCDYGKPRLSCMKPGEWYCALDMFVQGKGVEFKVASEFNEKSMLNAAKACYERLEKSLSDLGLTIKEKV